ncbi:MAG: hypothetical protein AAGA93_13415 [Actinomycetota bacterium]
MNALVDAALIDVEFPDATSTVCPASPLDGETEDLPTTEDELAELLFFVCLASAADGTDQAALETACAEVVDRIQDEYAFDDVLAALQGEDDVTAEGLADVLDAVFAKKDIIPSE